MKRIFLLLTSLAIILLAVGYTMAANVTVNATITAKALTITPSGELGWGSITQGITGEQTPVTTTSLTFTGTKNHTYNIITSADNVTPTSTLTLTGETTGNTDTLSVTNININSGGSDILTSGSGSITLDDSGNNSGTLTGNLNITNPNITADAYEGTLFILQVVS